MPLTYGPAAHWCRNVLAAGCCRVRIDGREYVLTRPTVVDRSALRPSLARFYRLVGIRDFLALWLDQGVPVEWRDAAAQATPRVGSSR